MGVVGRSVGDGIGVVGAGGTGAAAGEPGFAYEDLGYSYDDPDSVDEEAEAGAKSVHEEGIDEDDEEFDALGDDD